MDLVIFLVQVSVAGVLGVAGVAKWAHPQATQQATVDLGLPAALAKPISLTLPLVELGLAVALLLPPTTQRAGLVTAGLLLLFALLLAANLLRGRRPACACFGELQSRPIGWGNVARNGVLAAGAGLVAVGGPAHLGSADWQLLAWLGGIAGVALLAFQSWFLWQLFQQQGRVLARLAALEAQPDQPAAHARPAVNLAVGLPVGTLAPPFTLPDLSGASVALAALLAPGKPLVVLFTDPTCQQCDTLLPAVATWQQTHAAAFTVALISQGTATANQAKLKAKLGAHSLHNLLLAPDSSLREAYQLRGTPTALLIQPDGTIGSPLAEGVERVRGLVDALLQPTPAPASTGGCNCQEAHSQAQNGAAIALDARVRVGAPAPALPLRDLSGQSIELANFWGQPTVLLFWNPGCGYCRQMRTALAAWEEAPPAGAPRLLVIASGDAARMAAEGFAAPVLLDEAGSALAAFGTRGTPSALLINGTGHIATPVAAGAQAVMALLQQTNAATLAHPAQTDMASVALEGAWA